MPAGEGGGIELSVELDEGSVKAVLAAAKDFDPALAKALRKRLRLIGGEVAKDMQAEVKRTPSTGGRTPGRHNTRADIAAGIGVSVKTGKKSQGVYVTGSAKKMGKGRAAMPRAYNKPTFRHPVFAGTRGRLRSGDTRVKWVVQKGNPYFGSTIKRHEAAAEQAVADALADAVKEIGGDG